MQQNTKQQPTITVFFRIIENGIWKKGSFDVMGRNVSISFARQVVKKNFPGSIVMRCEYAAT